MRNKIIPKLLLITGVVLLIAAATALIVWQRNVRIYEAKSQSYVTMLQSILPSPQGAVPEARRDNTMAALSMDGTDFIGILEIPRFASTLPIGADWGNIGRYPCRYSGSVYDRTIQIGATTQNGQYDFYRELSVGDSVFFTDMEGNRYSYTISDLRYEKHADQETLQQQSASLTLFIKNIYAFEYLIISCSTQS